MDSTTAHILLETSSFRIYKDGHLDRLHGTDVVPAGFDAASGVTSKDVVIDGVTGVTVRLYLPNIPADESHNSKKKLPILVYFHGGSFVVYSAASFTYHSYLKSLTARAGVVAISVDYRLAPEHPLPAAYDDSWAALSWAVSGVDPWLSKHGDLGRVFLAGDSAGGNIVHNMAMTASLNGLRPPARVEGAILLHPGFCGKEPMETETAEFRESFKNLRMFAFPGVTDVLDDPRINPMAAGAPSLKKLACNRLLVCAAAKDMLRTGARAYYEAVNASGWGGRAAWFESEGEEHVFFLHRHGSREAVELMDRLVAFFSGR